MSNQLRELFEERFGTEPANVEHQARLASIGRRISSVRRRRAATAGAALAAVVAVVVATPTSVQVPQSIPESVGSSPTPTAKTIEGFPEYFEGARVVAAASASLPDTTATLTFVPKTLDLVAFTRCDPPEVWASLVLPDGGYAVGGCGREWGDKEAWAASGIRVGEPTTLVLKARATIRSENGRMMDGPLPASGTIAVAIAERVPFEEYPLPPRPATLPPLATAPIGTDVVTTVRNAPDDPLAPRTVEVAWEEILNFSAHLQTPGNLRVLVNGRLLMNCEKWTYTEKSPIPKHCDEEFVITDDDNPGKPGDIVTITVIPEHVTGDWAVRIDRPVTPPAKKGAK